MARSWRCRRRSCRSGRGPTARRRPPTTTGPARSTASSVCSPSVTRWPWSWATNPPPPPICRNTPPSYGGMPRTPRRSSWPVSPPPSPPPTGGPRSAGKCPARSCCSTRPGPAATRTGRTPSRSHWNQAVTRSAWPTCNRDRRLGWGWCNCGGASTDAPVLGAVGPCDRPPGQGPATRPASSCGARAPLTRRTGSPGGHRRSSTPIDSHRFPSIPIDSRRLPSTRRAMSGVGRLTHSCASSSTRSSRPSEPCERAAMCQDLRSKAAPRRSRAFSRPSSHARSPSL